MIIITISVFLYTLQPVEWQLDPRFSKLLHFFIVGMYFYTRYNLLQKFEVYSTVSSHSILCESSYPLSEGLSSEIFLARRLSVQYWVPYRK